MKITIAYIDGEEREAALIQRFASRLLDGARVRKSDRHPPFKHIYLTNRKPETLHNSKENACTIPPDVV